MAPVDHRLALSRPALLSAPDKKSFSRVSSPILACSVFTSIAGGGADATPPEPKQARGRLNQLALPGGDLARVHIVLLRQFGQRRLALDRGQRHLGLEGRGVGPACSLGHVCS